MGPKLQEGSNEGLLIGKSKLNEQDEKSQLAERSFDLRTSGLWAQHASTAPLCFVANAVLALNISYRLFLMDDAIYNYIYKVV